MSAVSIFSKHQVIQPPTPPFEHATDFDLDACETGLELLDSKHLAYNTPDESPNSTTEFMGKSPEERSAKRVDFVLIPNQTERTTRKGSRVEELKPRRSILKPTSHIFSSDPPSSDIAASVEEKDSPAMLEHMIRGLASQDVTARYDAYMSINRCLKTYKDMPTKQSLGEKMAMLDGCIRRDLAADTAEGVRASQMVTEALKFVTSLCWFPETRSVMTAGFQVFLLNHSITVLGKEDTPKLLANLYLYLLSIQTFPSRVMNQEKVIRILAVLRGVTERIKGRQATAHRLDIYKRLIGQAKLVMASRASDWVEDLFNNMISKTKEIRERAIALGFIAGHCFGSESNSSVADAVLRLMNKKSKVAEKRYIDDMILRLQGWLSSKQDTSEIPSIWSIVILLLRSRPNFPDHWDHLAQWLRIIQGCLNIHDPETRSLANLAWIRLIYAISPKQETSKSFSSLLFRPMKKQLERQEREKDTSGKLKKNIDGAYITLLYYAFRPGTDHQTLDRYWQEYIVPVFCQKPFLPIEEDLACRILISLFGSTEQVWQSNRALDTTNVLSPSELPRLDPKWVRSRAKMIASVVVMHLHKLQPNEIESDASWKSVWIAWIDAVKLAGAKEIKVSADTMTTTIEMVYIYRNLVSSIVDRDINKFEQAAWIISYLYTQLGSLPFLEKRILETEEGDKLELLSDRTNQPTGATSSALSTLNKSTLVVLEKLDWIRLMEKAPFPSSPSLLFCFSTVTTLMQAGFKSLSMEIRHSNSGQKHSKILDRLQQVVRDQPKDFCCALQQLFYFARWFDRRDDDLPVTPVVRDADEIQPAQIIETEDAVVKAKFRSTPHIDSTDTRPRSEKYEKPHQVQVQDLIKARITTPDPSLRRRATSATYQQPRIRHDNSQIEFATIDSSPTILRAMDSQLLTDRQKEVQERQVMESNNLFRDISSSSGPKSRNEETPRLQLSGHDRVRPGIQRIGSSSPILPPTGSMVVFLDCSPSPLQRRLSYEGKLDLNNAATISSGGTSMMHFTLDDPPSSPPAGALEALNKRATLEVGEDRLDLLEIDTSVAVANSMKDDLKDIRIDPTEEANVAEKPPTTQNFLSTSPGPADADDLVPLGLEWPINQGPIFGSSSAAQELELVDALSYTPEAVEDDELISSQIDHDLRHASQDTIIVESPRKQKQKFSPSKLAMTTTTTGSPGQTRKRSSPSTRDPSVPEQRTKRVKTAEVEPTSNTAASRDIVAELKALLDKAKSGLTSEQGLAILRISAEMTQVAVQALQDQ